jgi:hypothetical protein
MPVSGGGESKVPKDDDEGKVEEADQDQNEDLPAVEDGDGYISDTFTEGDIDECEPDAEGMDEWLRGIPDYYPYKKLSGENVVDNVREIVERVSLMPDKNDIRFKWIQLHNGYFFTINCFHFMKTCVNIQCPFATTSAILCKYKWDCDKLLKAFGEMGRDAFFQSLKMEIPRIGNDSNSDEDKALITECPLCYNDYNPEV